MLTMPAWSPFWMISQPSPGPSRTASVMPMMTTWCPSWTVLPPWGHRRQHYHSSNRYLISGFSSATILAPHIVKLEVEAKWWCSDASLPFCHGGWCLSICRCFKCSCHHSTWRSRLWASLCFHHLADVHQFADASKTTTASTALLLLPLCYCVPEIRVKTWMSLVAMFEPGSSL